EEPRAVLQRLVLEREEGGVAPRGPRDRVQRQRGRPLARRRLDPRLARPGRPPVRRQHPDPRPVAEVAMKSRRAGFTLVELLIVIVIIGILVALSTVGIVKALDSARASSTQTMLDSISGALAQY